MRRFEPRPSLLREKALSALRSLQGSDGLFDARLGEVAELDARAATRLRTLARKDTTFLEIVPGMTPEMLDAAARYVTGELRDLTFEPATESVVVEDEFRPENMTLTKAIDGLKQVIEHPDPFVHLTLILGAAQDHVVDLLHTVFYVVFSGGPDTGKGTANAASMALTRNGIVLGGASGAYLRDTLGDGRAISISGFETLVKENVQLLAVVRNGNRRATSRVGLKIPAGEGGGNVG